jgi:hypothetical protein
MAGEISPVRILYIDSVLLQGLAKMGFCVSLRRLNRELLPLSSASLAFDDVYPTAKGFQKSGNSIVEFAHCNLRDCG